MANLREATAADAAVISRIIATSWRSAYQGLIDDAYLARLPEEYWLPSMRTWLDSGRMYGLIAEENGFPVGSIIFGRGRDASLDASGEIVSLYVLPEVMGKGIGDALLTSALRVLQEDGYAQVYLWAIQGNARADRFYIKHGFCRTDDHIQYRIGLQDVVDTRYHWEG